MLSEVVRLLEDQKLVLRLFFMFASSNDVKERYPLETCRKTGVSSPLMPSQAMQSIYSSLCPDVIPLLIIPLPCFIVHLLSFAVSVHA